MNYALYSILIASLLFVGMLLLLELGQRAGNRRIAKDGEGNLAGISVIDGSVLGLLSLLLAFAFSGAATRFDARRQLIAVF